MCWRNIVAENCVGDADALLREAEIGGTVTTHLKLSMLDRGHM